MLLAVQLSGLPKELHACHRYMNEERLICFDREKETFVLSDPSLMAHPRSAHRNRRGRFHIVRHEGRRLREKRRPRKYVHARTQFHLWLPVIFALALHSTL